MGPFGRKPVMTNQPIYQRPPAPRAGASVDQAINTGAMREGQLAARIGKLEQDIAGYKREMQRNRPGSSAHTAAKRRAVNALKQKRTLDAQAASVGNGLFNLEQVKDVREQIQFQKEQASAIQASHQVLQQEQSGIDIDHIEELQDDIGDAMVEVNEVSDALGRSYDVEPVDESELMAELEGFENEDFASVSAAAPAAAPSYLNPAPVPGGSAAYQPPAPYQAQGQQNPNPANYY